MKEQEWKGIQTCAFTEDASIVVINTEKKFSTTDSVHPMALP
jgi:hypothetical protein